MPSVTFREYNPENGALLGNISTLKFGEFLRGTHSRVKVLDIAFGGVTAVTNIKLGLITSGGITVNSEPTDIGADGSAANGHFGIETSSSFISSKALSPLTRHFAGSNTDAKSYSEYNVSIGNKSDLTSNYIYLDMDSSNSTTIKNGNGTYKVFFDYY